MVYVGLEMKQIEKVSLDMKVKLYLAVNLYLSTSFVLLLVIHEWTIIHCHQNNRKHCQKVRLLCVNMPHVILHLPLHSLTVIKKYFF